MHISHDAFIIMLHENQCFQLRIIVCYISSYPLIHHHHRHRQYLYHYTNGFFSPPDNNGNGNMARSCYCKGPLDTCIATRLTCYPNILQVELYALRLAAKNIKSLQYDMYTYTMTILISFPSFPLTWFATRHHNLSIHIKMLIAAIFAHLCLNKLMITYTKSSHAAPTNV